MGSLHNSKKVRIAEWRLSSGNIQHWFPCQTFAVSSSLRGVKFNLNAVKKWGGVSGVSARQKLRHKCEKTSYKALASFPAPCGRLWFNHLKVCHWKNKRLRHAWVEINGRGFKNKLHGNIVLNWCNQTQQACTKSYLYDSYLRAVRTVTVPGSHWFYSGWLPCCCLCSCCIGLNFNEKQQQSINEKSSMSSSLFNTRANQLLWLKLMRCTRTGVNTRRTTWKITVFSKGSNNFQSNSLQNCVNSPK